jgi:hypothetical protein
MIRHAWIVMTIALVVSLNMSAAAEARARPHPAGYPSSVEGTARRAALAQAVFGMGRFGRWRQPDGARSRRSPCLGSAQRYVTDRSGAGPCGGDLQAGGRMVRFG